MGGFLGGLASALGLMVPVGQGIRAMTQTQDVTNALQQQNLNQRNAFSALMKNLPAGTQFDPFRRMYEAGGSVQDVASAMGAFGPIFQDMDRQQKFHELFPDSASFSDPSKIAAAEMQGLFKDIQPDVLKQLLHLPSGKYIYGMPLEQFEGLPTQEARDAAIKHFEEISKKPEGPVKWQSFPGGDIIDPGSGYALKTRDMWNPETLERKQEIVGLDPTGQQKDTLAQAGEVIRAIPDAVTAAQKVQTDLGGFPGTAEQANAQRRQMLRQYRAYTAARKAAGIHPFDVFSWGWWTGYGNVSPDFAEYFTLMGQIQAQAAAPMHIFRSQGLFQQIAPHINAAEDLPYLNLERLKRMRSRWEGDLNTVNRLQSGAAEEPDVRAFIAKGGANRIPEEPPINPFPDLPPDTGLVAAPIPAGGTIGGGKPIWRP